jgi:hypothetical protein
VAVVTLPPTFDISAIDRFASELVRPDLTPKHHEVALDFKRLNFIDGSGITVLTNTLSWLQTKHVKMRFYNFDDLRRHPIAYLDDCGFFQKHLGSPLSFDSRIRPTTLPCMSLETARAFSWIEHRFSPWFEHEIGCSHSASASLRTCIKELFHNIDDHSSLNTGFVHAQHYPNNRTVRVTVSDFGVGIPHTIRSRYPGVSDHQAILEAIEEGVTAKSKSNNMGIGLNYLVETILENRGQVRIRSHGGALLSSIYRRKRDHKAWSTKAVYPGTLVEFSLDTRLFEGDTDERGTVEW